MPLFVFYLPHRLVRVCEIELSHMCKSNGNPDLVCEKKYSYYIFRFKYYMSEDDIILKWKPRNTPVGRFMKAYEKYWKTRQCPK